MCSKGEFLPKEAKEFFGLPISVAGWLSLRFNEKIPGWI